MDMPITDSTFNNINTAMTDCGLHAIARDAAEVLVTDLGPTKLQTLFAAARASDFEAKVELNQISSAAGAYLYLRSLGVEHATLEAVISIVNSRGYPDLFKLMEGVAEDNPNAKTVLDQWLKQPSSKNQQPLEDDALLETTVPPPGAQPRAGQTSDARSTGNGRPQTTQRPNQPSGQTYRSNGAVAARTPTPSDARPIQNNVHQLPARSDLDQDLSGSDNAPPQDGDQAASQRQYDQHTCYGRDVAVQFERTPTRDRTNNTVNIKIAKAKSGTCKQGVDWDNGIILMLVPHEIQLVYAVMMGMRPDAKCRFAGHGSDNQKWFEVSETDGDFSGAIRLTVGNGRSDIRRINIGHTDIKAVCEVLSRTLQDQAKGQSPVFMLAEIRRVYDLYAHVQARQDAKRQASR